jgi:hypothetical protein
MSEVVKVIEEANVTDSTVDACCANGVCADVNKCGENGANCQKGECCPEGVCEKVEAPVQKKPVAFLMDIESKAIVESLGDLEDFSVSNLMTVLPRLMKHVENYKNLRGSQKRELVIKMVKHLIDITDGPGNDEVWDPILKQLVPGLIDTLIQVNDGKLRLRKKPLSFLKVFCCKSRPKVDA